MEITEVVSYWVSNVSGTFKPTQMLDVIGQVADKQNPTLAYLQVINSFPLHFKGCSDPITKKRKAKYNPGNADIPLI